MNVKCKRPILTMIVSFVLLASCRNTSYLQSGLPPTTAVKPLSQPDLMDVLQEQFPIFAGLVEKTGHANLLRSEGPLTVFAATDEAFAKLPEGAFDKLLTDIGLLNAYIEEQIAPGIWPVLELRKGDIVCDALSGMETLGGMTIYGLNERAELKVGSATVVNFDIEAKNGLVQGVDYVNVPSRDPIWWEVSGAITLWEGVERMQDYLYEVGGPYDPFCGTHELGELLDGDGPFTFFVPTDEAFGQLEAELGVELTYYGTIGEIVRYLIVDGVMLVPEVGEENVLNTYQGSRAQISFEDEKTLQINGVKITVVDRVHMRNGMAYLIDWVPIPPGLDLYSLKPTIWQIVESSDQLTIFENLMRNEGVWEYWDYYFSAWGPTTIFAPSDEVFMQMSPDEREQWRNSAFYHYYTARSVPQEMLRSKEYLHMTSGQDVVLQIDGETIYFGEAQVISAIEAQNGMVYILDALTGVEDE